jgi:hypothetical protein
MNDITIFLTGIGLTLVSALLVVAYLKPHLQRILVDLCGTEERARFWTVFSNVTLILIPMIAAMSCRPNNDVSPFFQLSTQLQWGLIGLIGSVVVMGLLISRFIPPLRPLPSNPQNSQ